jgi:hypothetical protein
MPCPILTSAQIAAESDEKQIEAGKPPMAGGAIENI